jgi:hypothetical protein
MTIASIGEIRSIEPIALGQLGAWADSVSQGVCIFAGGRAGAKESSRSPRRILGSGQRTGLDHSRRQSVSSYAETTAAIRERASRRSGPASIAFFYLKESSVRLDQ